MIIRAKQKDVLREAAVRTFEDQMVDHVRQFTPRHFEVLGEAGTRAVVRPALARGRGHGFNNRGPLRLFVELVFLLGSDFDTDPQFPWAARVLEDDSEPDEMARADRLYDKTLQYVDAVAGPDNIYAKQALRRASQVRFEELAVPASRFEDELLARMSRMHPEKYVFVGEQALRSLIRGSVETARSFSISQPAGFGLFAGMAFALGHGFARDPQHPWIESTLENEAISGADRRVERVYSKAMTYLSKVLERF